MTTRCIDSAEIISHSDRQERRRVERTFIRVHGATHYHISGRRFVQSSVNPHANDRMKRFPRNCSEVYIVAEPHAHNINYSLVFR